GSVYRLRRLVYRRVVHFSRIVLLGILRHCHTPMTLGYHGKQ
ncbi:MAG: hypothetical protein ACI855_003783, partial [Myxococcota bacterium]